jgi:hypothetical protein
MDNYGIDANNRPAYLNSYLRAAEQHLDGDAITVVEWMSQFQTSSQGDDRIQQDGRLVDSS